MKKIVINADDFGLTEAVTLGIIKGHSEGIISSTSLMVNMPYAKQAADLAKEYPLLGVGVHLNVTKGRPISDYKKIRSIVTDEGLFYSSKDYMNNNVEIVEEELLIEFIAQIDKFIEYNGDKPDHIDCHHLHDFFGIYPKVTEYLIKTYGVPMRLEQNHKSYKYPLAKKLDVFMNSAITEDGLCEYLNENASEDLIEIPNHSGFVDYELMKLSSLNVNRVNDLHLCLSTKVKSTLDNLGYKIVRWSEIN